MTTPTYELPAEPTVTVAVPMLNELGAIEHCLDSFAEQDFPSDRLEVLIIDGGSTDGSRAYVEERARIEPWIRVVDNPEGSAAAAFDIGAHQGRGDVVFLFSSHGEPAFDYVSSSVKVLQETGAVGVGGLYRHLGTTPQSSAIGLAMTSPFGMASTHRIASARTATSERRSVDTISHPAYVRRALVDIGGFDRSLARNSDYEINIRLRQAGHDLIFDSRIESIYRPRPSLEALARQFWFYGRWKARVARQHPGDLKPRHLAAPAFAVGAAATVPALLLHPLTRRLAGAGWLGYAAATVVAARSARATNPDADLRTLLAAFPTMHGAWGFGFVTSVLTDLRKGDR